MGSEFFWFYDAVVVAVIAVNVFRGIRRGAVGVLISAIAAILSFIIAFALSGTISEAVYGKYIKEPLIDYITERIDDAVNIEMIDTLRKIDMSKALVKDTYITDIKPEYDVSGKAIVDLSSVDMSLTGIDKADLSVFGVQISDVTAVKLGNITVTRQEMNKYSLGEITLAHLLASGRSTSDVGKALRQIGDKISDTMPIDLNNIGSKLSDGSTEMSYRFILGLVNVSDKSYGEKMIGDIISPVVLTPLKVVIFLIVFVFCLIILSIIANVSQLINKIPVVSKFNISLGALLGLVEAVITVFVICIVIKLIISLCGDSLVFINNTTVEKTFIFRHFYAIDPLRLINIT